MMEPLDVGFRPRRVAKLVVIQPVVACYWHRRFHTLGLPGLDLTDPRCRTVTVRVSVQVLMSVFQLLGNNRLWGHYWVKRDAVG
jgi:hypothetical protein